LLESVLSYDSAGAAAACKIPTLYVSSGPWYTDVQQFKELCPQFVTAQIIGAGHYFPLEVPDQLNPIIARFIQIHVKSSMLPGDDRDVAARRPPVDRSPA
jgi:pimeloyl-ACP methyl ester carboxylesterase